MERLLFGKGDGAVVIGAAAYQRRKIQLIGYIIAIVVGIIEIGRAIAVAVGRSRVPFLSINDAIQVAIGEQRVAVPLFAAIGKANHLHIVGERVKVRVRREGVGAEQAFLGIGQPVAISIEGGGL